MKKRVSKKKAIEKLTTDLDKMKMRIKQKEKRRIKSRKRRVKKHKKITKKGGGEPKPSLRRVLFEPGYARNFLTNAVISNMNDAPRRRDQQLQQQQQRQWERQQQAHEAQKRREQQALEAQQRRDRERAENIRAGLRRTGEKHGFSLYH